MRTMPDNSIDAIVCDPPYGLSPDGKARTWDDIAELRAQGKGPRGGFMGRAWDAAVPGVTWARECLRVLKPGGHLIAFSSTRTSGRLMCALEDGGFEIRDTIHWLHYQGFPKSLDISKAIDKAAGAEREVVGSSKAGASWGSESTTFEFGYNRAWDITAPATDNAKRWNGWGTALKPAIEPAILARKPLDAFTPEETSVILGSDHLWSSKSLDTPAKRAAAAKRWGVPIPEGAAEWTGRPLRRDVAGIKELRAGGDVIATTAGPEYSAAKISTVMLNVLRWGTGALNVDACRYAYGDKAWPGPDVGPDEINGRSGTGMGTNQCAHAGRMSGTFTANDLGRWPANVYHCPKPSRREREAGTEHLAGLSACDVTGRKEGSAGSKHARAGRTAIGRLGNHHPTVKPLALMRWLLRLVTPPGGVAFDPFVGSGTAMVAGVQEGIAVIGAELSDEYVSIIEARTLHALRERAKG